MSSTFFLSSGRTISLPSGWGLVLVGIQLAQVSSGCATPLSSLSPCKLFWTLALPCVLPPTEFIYLHTLLWQPRVLSWRCGRAPRPSKSTPVLPSVWLGPRASAEGYCWVPSYAGPKGPRGNHCCPNVYFGECVCVRLLVARAQRSDGRSWPHSGSLFWSGPETGMLLNNTSVRNALLQQGLDTGSTRGRFLRGTMARLKKRDVWRRAPRTRRLASCTCRKSIIDCTFDETWTRHCELQKCARI